MFVYALKDQSQNLDVADNKCMASIVQSAVTATVAFQAHNTNTTYPKAALSCTTVTQAQPDTTRVPTRTGMVMPWSPL